MYCSECGFHQSEAHKYCGRCGALLIVENQGTGEITGPARDQRRGGRDRGPGRARPSTGPTLAVRSGGPPGAIFPLDHDDGDDRPRAVGGRLPGRRHRVAQPRRHHAAARRARRCATSGSLNGTYVNRRRIEGEELLEDGDELQIGKFRLTFLRRVNAAEPPPRASRGRPTTTALTRSAPSATC